MFRHRNSRAFWAALACASSVFYGCARSAGNSGTSFDVVVVGATPGGIMAAIAAARAGHTAVLLERTTHIGGMVANGLGATDIATSGATGGLFAEFIERVRAHYVEVYGAGSRQALDSSGGYHFEPSVAEAVLEGMISEQPRIRVRLERQFDALPASVRLSGTRLAAIRVTNRASAAVEEYTGRVFVDATYEGDLAAAAGVPFRLGRESRVETGETLAGKVYKSWDGPVAAGSTGEGDQAIQAYNFRLCLTRRADRVPIEKPATYDRNDYASIVADVQSNLTTQGVPAVLDGITRVANLVPVPNEKTDANNQHLAFVSTDLPEENVSWPTADWATRDRIAARLRDYTLGLLWFCQNDPDLPADFRAHCSEWGLARDEFVDNGNFPRQPYVREGRRIKGEAVFTARDAQPAPGGERPPVNPDSVTSAHYALDSHAVHKREAGKVNLDGFFNIPTRPYTVPYGVMVPTKVDGLLVPVAVSATHVGFGSLRMEPNWMALGQAAGTAAALAIERGTSVRTVNRGDLQQALVRQKAVLIYYQDVSPLHPAFEAVQFFGLRGFLPGWMVRPDDPVDDEADRWADRAGVERPAGAKTRGEVLQGLYRSVRQLAATPRSAFQAP